MAYLDAAAYGRVPPAAARGVPPERARYVRAGGRHQLLAGRGAGPGGPAVCATARRDPDRHWYGSGNPLWRSRGGPAHDHTLLRRSPAPCHGRRAVAVDVLDLPALVSGSRRSALATRLASRRGGAESTACRGPASAAGCRRGRRAAG